MNQQAISNNIARSVERAPRTKAAWETPLLFTAESSVTRSGGGHHGDGGFTSDSFGSKTASFAS